MPDQHTYLIQLRGSVDVDELNARAPLWISGARAEAATTLMTVCSDQAGLIGLLRHLHGSGLQLLSITCESPHQENRHVEIKTDAAG
jgi:hypothetical protein